MHWKSILSAILADHPKSTVIQIATTDSHTGAPRVRSHIFRKFLAAAQAPHLPLLVTTTDIRAPKVAQLLASPRVEVVWWIPDAQTQFRIAGAARLVPHPAHELYPQCAAVLADKGAGGGVGALARESFDWPAEAERVFASLSPYTRASWCKPVPGSPLSNPEEARGWPEQVDAPGEQWDAALRNFALLVVDPDDVDVVELGVVPNRRTRFWIRDGEWAEQALVP
ncbi:hypothetical protein BD779DRAFT_1667018 [Infundibulicybe gibba]|nr:hypothetical protein BD779DRAFT_1667018 [Infundibulicybe gibba]